jgi:hypothetical protein
MTHIKSCVDYLCIQASMRSCSMSVSNENNAFNKSSLSNRCKTIKVDNMHVDDYGCDSCCVFSFTSRLIQDNSKKVSFGHYLYLASTDRNWTNEIICRPQIRLVLSNALDLRKMRILSLFDSE